MELWNAAATASFSSSGTASNFETLSKVHITTIKILKLDTYAPKMRKSDVFGFVLDA